jgi:hypothetical protein
VAELIGELAGAIEDVVETRVRQIVDVWRRDLDHLGGNAGGGLPRDGRTGSLVPLPRAQRDFRARYLRQLLAETPHLPEAARRAGIPYRTLCDNISKLGLNR